jgi:hypothetical protein
MQYVEYETTQLLCNNIIQKSEGSASLSRDYPTEGNKGFLRGRLER